MKTIMSKLNTTNCQKEKSPREDVRIKDQLIWILQSPVKRLNYSICAEDPTMVQFYMTSSEIPQC